MIANTRASTTAKLQLNPDVEINDIQYKLIKLKPHSLNANTSRPSSTSSKDYEEKYANQLEIGEAYQVEYDENNLQGTLIVNSDTMGSAAAQSESPHAKHAANIVILYIKIISGFLLSIRQYANGPK